MERTQVCSTCGETGVSLSPLEYPNFPNSRWCTECEIGRAYALRAVEIVAASREAGEKGSRGEGEQGRRGAGRRGAGEFIIVH